jgi:hypothetical protein
MCPVTTFGGTASGATLTVCCVSLFHYLESCTDGEPTLPKVIRALFDNTVAFLATPGHLPSCMTLGGRWAAV